LFETAFPQKRKGADNTKKQGYERETPFSFRPDVEPVLRSYHRTGAESYYDGKTKCKGF